MVRLPSSFLPCLLPIITAAALRSVITKPVCLSGGTAAAVAHALLFPPNCAQQVAPRMSWLGWGGGYIIDRLGRTFHGVRAENL